MIKAKLIDVLVVGLVASVLVFTRSSVCYGARLEESVALNKALDSVQVAIAQGWAMKNGKEGTIKAFVAQIEQALSFVKIAKRQSQDESFEGIEKALNEAIAQAKTRHPDLAIKAAEKAHEDFRELLSFAERPGGCPEGRPCPGDGHY